VKFLVDNGAEVNTKDIFGEYTHWGFINPRYVWHLLLIMLLQPRRQLTAPRRLQTDE